MSGVGTPSPTSAVQKVIDVCGVLIASSLALAGGVMGDLAPPGETGTMVWQLLAHVALIGVVAFMLPLHRRLSARQLPWIRWSGIVLTAIALVVVIAYQRQWQEHVVRCPIEQGGSAGYIVAGALSDEGAHRLRSNWDAWDSANVPGEPNLIDPATRCAALATLGYEPSYLYDKALLDTISTRLDLLFATALLVLSLLLYVVALYILRRPLVGPGGRAGPS